MRSELASVTTKPESRIACMPATTPYCMKASMRRASLALMIRLEIEVADLAAEMRREIAASNRVTGPMPLRPPTIDAHARGDVVADRRDDPKTRNDDASFAQRQLLKGMLERRTSDASGR